MVRGVCLISAGLAGGSGLEEVFLCCGLQVWTSQSAEDASTYGDALCLVIDMPRDTGYRTLRLFRDYGIETPALLIVDPGCELAVSELNCAGVMDVIARDVSTLRVLRWIQSMYAARNVLDQVQRIPA
jgi:DNA-binding NarL/FixJ family response regulator